MIAYYTIGVSASGKSTWAREKAQEIGAVLIDRDQYRIDILRSQGVNVTPATLWKKWDFSQEPLVTRAIANVVGQAIATETPIVFAETNLNQKHLNNSIETMKSVGYKTEVVAFPVNDIDVVIKRDAKREATVGEDVLRTQWKRWLALGEAVTNIRQYVANPNLPKAVVVDIDGTVAKMVSRGPFEWDKVGEDVPREFVCEMVRNFANSGNHIIFLSGRDSVCRKQTSTWLTKTFPDLEFDLFMRKEGDMRKDRIIKDELFFEHVVNNYNVVCAIDDRKQMIQYWTDIGVNLVNVGNPYDNF